MTGILARRRAMMQAAAAPAPSNKIVPDYWESGGINSSGSLISTAVSQRTGFIQIPAGAIGIKRLGEASYNGNTIYMYAHAYNANGTRLSPRSDPIEVGTPWLWTGSSFSNWANATQIRLTFAFSTASGVEMTNAILASCYDAEWVV